MELKQKKTLFLVSLAAFISSFGDYIFDIGVVVYLFNKTNSPMVISGFFVSQLLPSFLYFIFAGTVIDSVDKKKLTIILNIVRALILILLVFNQSIILIYFVSVILGFFDEFARTTNHTIIPQIFYKDSLVKVNSFLSVIDSASMIIGPIVVTVLITVLNFEIITLINAVSFLLVAVLYLFVDIDHNENTNLESTSLFRLNYIRGLKDGLKKVAGDKKLAQLTIHWSIFMFCVGISMSLAIFILTKKLGVGASAFGMLTLVEGIGILAGSSFVMNNTHKLNAYSLIKYGLLVSFISYVIIGSSSHLYFLMIGYVFVGIAASFCPVGFRTVIQQNIDDEVMGKTFVSIRFIVILVRMAAVGLAGSLSYFIGLDNAYYLIATFAIISFFMFSKTNLVTTPTEE